MHRLNFIVLFTILSIIGRSQDTNVRVDVDVNEKELINALSDVDPEIRATAAQKIYALIIKNQNIIAKGNIMEHTTDYWTAKIKNNKPKMKKDDFEKEFFDEKIDFIPNYDNVKFYQLDHFHLLMTEISKKKVTIKSLTINPIFFNFEPNETYTGKWVTYYITGSVSKESEYTNCIKHGTEIIYNWNGQKSWMKLYENGDAMKLFSFKDGQMQEASLELLEVELEKE